MPAMVGSYRVSNEHLVLTPSVKTPCLATARDDYRMRRHGGQERMGSSDLGGMVGPKKWVSTD